ncbi:hypothetical protein BBP40_004260 [Aspergillus hancockii]|nr:hypothetical protein BBP40_004260 [Aspergillus hancockii]
MDGYKKVSVRVHPSKSQRHYAAVHSEDFDGGVDEANHLSEELIGSSRLASYRHHLTLNCILFISFVLAVTSLIVTFTARYTIVRRDLIGLDLLIPPGILLCNLTPSLVSLSMLKTPVPLEMRTFGPSEIFTERQSERSHAAWDVLAGSTLNEQGFIYIPNWEELKLPPGDIAHGQMMYGISTFHQFRCLHLPTLIGS